MNKINLFLLFTALFCVFSCKNKEDFSGKIRQLEQTMEAHFDPKLATQLADLYKKAAKANPDNHAENLDYFTKAASLQYSKLDDAVSACRGLDDAMIHHSKGQNLTKTIGLYSQIYNGVLYNSTKAIRLDPSDVEKMRTHLTNHSVWIDSTLARLDKEMLDKNLIITDKEKASTFIETCETYANIIRSTDADKATNLTLKAAGVAKSIENFNKATQLYESIASLIPAHAKSPTALFMMAFVYENDLQNMAKAKETYELFLKKFPEDKDYADDAIMALKNLGKSPEDLIKEFESKK
jgi:tetratricopeptide (TPR) repeat protein